MKYRAVVIGVGIIVLLIGFALMIPRGGMPGSAAARNVMLGSQRVSTRGYAGEPSSRRNRIIQVLIGLVLVVVGVALIAASG